MTRTVSAITTAAVGQTVTKPVYLIRMAWDTERRICTWDLPIAWNAESWSLSGAEVKNLSSERGTLILPNAVGTEGDIWLSLVTSEIALDRAIEIYEHHTSTASPQGSDAELVFSGFMDEVTISGTKITISLVEGRTNKGFPPSSLGPSIHNYLLPVGTTLTWGADTITVN